MKRNNNGLPYFELMASRGIYAKPKKKISQEHTQLGTTEINTSGVMQHILKGSGLYPHGLKESTKGTPIDLTPVIVNDYAFKIYAKDGTVRAVRFWTPKVGYTEVDLW